MSNQNELRGRMRSTIDRALDQWMNSTDATDTEGDFVAQAIIDEFGLAYVTADEYLKHGFDTTLDEGGTVVIVDGRRVVGKWERQ